MMKPRRVLSYLLISLLTVSVAACGGSKKTTPQPVNKAPIVNAGADIHVNAGENVILSGSADDGDGSIASYQWVQQGGSVNIVNSDKASASFVAPDVSSETTLGFTLTATDNDAASASDEMLVIVSPQLKTTLTGRAYNGLITGATVTLKSNDGQSVSTTTSDDSGNFSFQDIKQSILNAGYSLEVTGGLIDGQPFADTLLASYFDAGAAEHSNITAMTTLVDNLAAKISTESSAGRQHTAAISLLNRIGLMGESDWNSLSSDNFDLDAIELGIQDAGGVQAWSDMVIADITSDTELSSPELNALFPHAHAGLTSVTAQAVTLFSGTESTIPVAIESSGSNDASVLTLSSAPDWLTITDGTVLARPPEGTSPGKYSAVLDVSLDGVHAGRKTDITVDVVKPVILLEGELNNDGVTLTNQWQDIAISAPAGALTQAYSVQYIGGVSADGETLLKFNTNPQVSDVDLDNIELLQPDTEIIKNNYLLSSGLSPIAASTSKRIDNRSENLSITSKSQTESSAQRRDAICLYEQSRTGMDTSGRDVGNNDGFSFGKMIVFSKRISANKYGFAGTGGIKTYPMIVPSMENRFVETGETVVSKCGAMLLADSSATSSESGEPVILVHGYSMGDMAPIDSYFGNLPVMLKAHGFVPYFYAWNTNQRFEDAAFVLGKAIEKINSDSKKKVHLVGHSFGGVVIRTLLQGKAEAKVLRNNKLEMIRQFESAGYFDSRVASVTTIGSPHSGVFGDNEMVSFDGGDNIVFPDGRDNEMAGSGIASCSSVPCYELGVPWRDLEDKNYGKYFGVKEKKGQTAFALANSFETRYPKSIPTNILIGMYFESSKKAGQINKRCITKPDSGKCHFEVNVNNAGDGLISLAGQRLSPSLNGRAVYTSGSVSEHLLGIDSMAKDFVIGYQDGLLDVINEIGENCNGSNGGCWVRTGLLVNKNNNAMDDDDKYYIASYHHMSSKYDATSLVSTPSNEVFRFYKRSPVLSEAGFQECDKAHNYTCNNNSWFYIYDLITKNAGQAFNSDSKKITASAKIKKSATAGRISARTPSEELISELSNYQVHIFIDGDEVGSTTTSEDGSFTLDVDFQPNRTYVLEVYPPADMDPSIAPRAAVVEKTTAETVEESDLNFSEIELIGKSFQQGTLSVALKDGSTGQALTDFSMTLKNHVNTLVSNKWIATPEDASVTLPFGLYTVSVTKQGYSGTAIAKCVVKQLVDSACVVTMVPDGYVVTGGLSAVLTWGQDPRDLDSHLIRYDSSGNQICHLFYSNIRCDADSLDVDDTTSYGPETINIASLDPEAQYTYAVHHYSGSGSISSTSQAKVTVTLADGSTREFAAPTSGDGYYWRVFDIVNSKLLPCQSNCIVNDVLAPSAARSTRFGDSLRWQRDIKDALQPKAN